MPLTSPLSMRIEAPVIHFAAGDTINAIGDLLRMPVATDLACSENGFVASSTLMLCAGAHVWMRALAE